MLSGIHPILVGDLLAALDELVIASAEVRASLFAPAPGPKAFPFPPDEDDEDEPGDW